MFSHQPFAPVPLFQDRLDAGRQLAVMVRQQVADPRAVVLALPRGGVPVAFEVAQALQADLDVFIVRKLGLPGHEELAIGAIASGGVRVLNHDLLAELRLSERLVESVTAREVLELQRREQVYREGRPLIPVTGRTAILVDDGLATGATMRAACRAVRVQQPSRLVMAVPVGPLDSCQSFQQEADTVICLATPEPFQAVGAWYDQFSQTSDDEVRTLLAQAAHSRPTTS